MTDPDCPHVVMIVEDDADVREILSEIVADQGFCAVSASNGRDALDELRAAPSPPCVILLDMMMPVMDGWQFRAEQRRDPALGGIPVVVLSAHADASEAAESMHAAAFLGKPVDLDRLLEVIRRLCR